MTDERETPSQEGDNMRFADIELHKFVQKSNLQYKELSSKVDSIQESTAGMVKAWESLEGFLRVVLWIRNGVLFVLSFSGVVALYDWWKS